MLSSTCVFVVVYLSQWLSESIRQLSQCVQSQYRLRRTHTECCGDSIKYRHHITTTHTAIGPLRCKYQHPYTNSQLHYPRWCRPCLPEINPQTPCRKSMLLFLTMASLNSGLDDGHLAVANAPCIFKEKVVCAVRCAWHTNITLPKSQVNALACSEYSIKEIKASWFIVC